MHNLMMMLTLLIQVFVVIHLFSGTYGFCQSSPSCFGKHGKHLGTAASLTQLKPVGGDGVIPRLEPGLRFVQSRANFLVQMQEKKVTISKFSLNCLSKYAPETIAPPAGSDVINSVFNTASKVSSFLSRYARKGLALTAVVVSLGAFPRNVLARGHTPLKTATMIGTAFLAAADLATAAPTRPLTLTPPKPSSGAVELANSLNPLRLWDRISSSFNQNIGIVKENFNIDMNLMKWKNYDTLTASQRLGTTPVYFVANARGSSYIQNDAKAGNPDQKIITYFLGYDDASRVLQEMTQMNSNGRGGTADFRLKTTSLERVVNMIQRHKQSRKLGRYEVDTILRIQPSGLQYNNALKIQKQIALRLDASRNLDLRGVHVPLFKAEGFTMKRSNGEVVTPYYFSYEDLVEDWNGAATVTSTGDIIGTGSGGRGGKKSRGGGAALSTFSVTDVLIDKTVGGLKRTFIGNGQPKVSVHDLADVMCRIQNITPNTTLPPNYIPPVPTTRLQRLQQRVLYGARLATSLHRSLPAQQLAEKLGSVGSAIGADKLLHKLLPRATEVEEEVEEEEEESGGAMSFVKNIFRRGSGDDGGDSIDDSTASTDGADRFDSMNVRGVWTSVKSSVGGALSTLKTLRAADRQSKEVVGIVPPRKEIELLRKFYRNQVGFFKNEFARAKFMG